MGPRAFGCFRVPSGIRPHSTFAVATSWALWRAASLATIYAAATWSSQSTFSGSYCLNVAASPSFGEQVLGVTHQWTTRPCLFSTKSLIVSLRQLGDLLADLSGHSLLRFGPCVLQGLICVPWVSLGSCGLTYAALLPLRLGLRVLRGLDLVGM